MKFLYFLIAYTWFLLSISGCAEMIEALEDEDWSAIGYNMQQTGRNIQQEQQTQKLKPQYNPFINQQYSPAGGGTCTTELVRNPVYGHYEALQLCR
jgi:hypothetical protein